MSTLTLRNPTPNWFDAILSTVANILGGIVEGHDISARYRALSRLSDAELRRLGLTREELPQAAVRGVPGY